LDASPSGFLKLNFDGGRMGIFGSGWGSVLRNCDGDILMTGFTNALNFADAEVKEAQACLFSIQAVWEVEHDNLVVEGGCLQLIQKLRSSQSPDNFVGLLVQDIQAYTRRFFFLYGGVWRRKVYR